MGVGVFKGRGVWLGLTVVVGLSVGKLMPNPAYCIDWHIVKQKIKSTDYVNISHRGARQIISHRQEHNRTATCLPVLSFTLSPIIT